MLDASRSAFSTPPGLQARSESGQALLLLPRDLPVAHLHRPEQPRHTLHRRWRRNPLPRVGEELEKRVRRPLRRQPEQGEQVPDLDGIHLHRRRGQQHKAGGAILQFPHQPEQRVRFVLAVRPGAPAAGVVRFVEDD